MNSSEALKPVDIVVGLRLAQAPGARYEQLRDDLGVSTSTAHASVRRLEGAGLLRPGQRAVNRLTFREFLEHGVRYAFPAHPGMEARGVPTAHSGPVLSSQIAAQDVFVWPDITGPSRGYVVEPLYRRAKDLPRRCPPLYEALTLVDGLRVGNTRERRLAMAELDRQLGIKALSE
jgi:hypothetical protein